MPIDLSELRSELKRVSAAPGQRKAGNNGQPFVKMPDSDGLLIVRILPAKSGKIKDIYQSTRLHPINKRNVHCPRELMGDVWKGLCPVCEYYNWLYRESKTKSKEEAAALQAEAKDIRPYERYYLNCIVKSQTGNYKDNQPNPLNTNLILSVGKQVFARVLCGILGSEEDMEEALGDVTDVQTGRDFKIIKKTKGEKGYQDYNTKFLDPSPLGTQEQIDQWLAGIHDLTALRQCKSAEDLKREIRIHRGVEKDPSVSFDLTELGIGNKAAPVVLDIAPAKTAAKTAAKSEDEDSAHLEDDFFQKLDAADQEIG